MQLRLNKKAQLRRYWVIYLSMLFFLSPLIISFSSGVDSFKAKEETNTELKEQIITRGANWDEVCQDSTCTKSYYGGIVNYKEDDEYVPIDQNINITNCETNYDYCIDKNLYQVHYKTDPTTAQSVRFVKDDYYFTFQPMSLNYRNSLDMIQQINTPQPVTGTVADNIFTYPNIFGEGLNITYSYYSTILKEKLIIENKSFLPQPESYILAQQNVTLDLDFLITLSAGIDVYIDGELWDKSTRKTTSNIVEFRNETDLLFYLPSPTASDSNNSQTTPVYEFKKGGNKLYVNLKTDYGWLNNSVGVIDIDPTVEYNFSVQESIYHYCFENGADAAPPNNPPNPFVGTILSNQTSNSGLDKSDGSYTICTLRSQYYPWSQSMVFIQEPISDISEINVTFENGLSVSNTCGRVSRLKYYFYNWSSSSFVQVGVDDWVGSVDILHTFRLSGGDITDFINSSNNHLDFIAHSDAPSCAIAVDVYNVKLVYDSNTIPSIDTLQKNVSATININESIRVNITVTDEDGNETIDAVWGEFKYPNATLINKTFTVYQSAFSCLNVTSSDCDACSIENNCTNCSDMSCSWEGSAGSYAINFTGFEADHTSAPYDGWSDPGVDLIPGETPSDYCSDTACSGTGTWNLQVEDDTASSYTAYTVNTDTACGGGECDTIIFSGYLYPNGYNSDSEGFQIYCDYGDGDEVLVARWLRNVGLDVCGETINMDTTWDYFECDLAAEGCDMDSSLEIRITQQNPLVGQGGGDQVYIDGLNITGTTTASCEGTLNCSQVTNQTGCEVCSLCEWETTSIYPYYYYDWTDTVEDGTYNVTQIWANDTEGTINSTVVVFGWDVNVTAASDSCSCAGLNTNWEIDLEDYCDLAECDLGAGNITWVNQGNATCDVPINASYVENLTSGGILWVKSSCLLSVG